MADPTLGEKGVSRAKLRKLNACFAWLRACDRIVQRHVLDELMGFPVPPLGKTNMIARSAIQALARQTLGLVKTPRIFSFTREGKKAIWEK